MCAFGDELAILVVLIAPLYVVTYDALGVSTMATLNHCS